MFKHLFALIALLCSACLAAQDNADATLTFNRPETATQGKIEMSSADFSQGGAIPDRFSAYGEGISPALAWTGVPNTAQSLVLIVEDPDANSAKPFIHWLAWNIAPAAGSLTQNAARGPMVQGINSRGSAGYFGPKPSGSKPHRYYFELFALDIKLSLPAGARRPEVLAAMSGHVIAKGQLMGLFRKP
jgi:Raf kinase inhibitor-like YbhB/YbcL family protein